MNSIQVIPPPDRFTNNILYVNDLNDANKSFQNGMYLATSSSYSDNSHNTFHAFDGSTNTFWRSGDISGNLNIERKTYTRAAFNGLIPSSFVGGSDTLYWSTLVGNEHYYGEWIQIQIPYSVYLAEYSIRSSNFPRKFALLGSIDGLIWVLLDKQSLTSSPTTNSNIRYVAKSIIKYSYFRLVISQLFQGTTATITELNIKGNNNLLLNIKPTESFSNMNFQIYNENKISSTEYISSVKMPCGSCGGYKPYSSYEVLSVNKLVENFDSRGFVEGNVGNTQIMQIQPLNEIINDTTELNKTVNLNSNKLTNDLIGYYFVKSALLSSNYDYSGNTLLYLNDEKPKTVDALQSDVNEYAIQEKNVFIIGSISMAILILGSIMFLRN
uniref:F5/8 type C domain-containing protein n=1 Tax=viral metagenome TaxID=1070528 RepID=A0A6C0LRM0_9ZZZZ